MADQAISALTEVTAPAVSDVLPIVSGGITKKVQIANLVKPYTTIWARVYHNAVQSINNTTLTALIFNSEHYDTDAIHDNSTDNNRLTCKTAGIYLIISTVDFAVNSTGTRILNLRLNGSTVVAGTVANAIVTNPTRISVSTIYPLAVNDYMEALVYQSSGGALNIDSTGNTSPEFMMARLGA